MKIKNPATVKKQPTSRQLLGAKNTEKNIVPCLSIPGGCFCGEKVLK
jgi:hypothetical protein